MDPYYLALLLFGAFAIIVGALVAYSDWQEKHPKKP